MVSESSLAVTKSGQIRNLAESGMSVSEIAKRLSIRYQHVYSVLSKSRDGVPTTKRVAKAEPQPKPALNVCKLQEGGFIHAASWAVNEAGLLLDTAVSKEAGVYAFAISGVVQYVGVATGGLKGRLYGYIRPGRGQPTNIRINQFIRDQLTQGNEVQVFVASPEASSWNGLPVHLIAGLELGLIQAHHLPWNVKGTR